jgi:nitrite reductase/ring-hydroxylating ferredoxin subunit
MTARPNQPAPGTKLVRFDELAETDAKGFSFGEGKERFQCFVLRWQGGVFGYVNECPHARTSLDWQPDRFFNLRRDALQCGTHGALFEPVSGHCFLGPCKGKSLLPFPVKLEDGWITAA